MPSYKVKHPISKGPAPKKKAPRKQLQPGEEVELTEQEAWELRQSLEEPPLQDPSLEEELDEEVLQSLLDNPENPDSGIELYFKSRPDISVRPETNKTKAEKEAEPERQKAEAKDQAERHKKGQPTVPDKPGPAPASATGRPAPTPPVVPPVTRQAPKP